MTNRPFEYRGKWYIQFRDESGKRKRKLLSGKKREAFRLWKEGLANASCTHIDATFARVANEWLAAQEKRLDAGLVSPQWVARVSRTVEAFTTSHPRVRCSQVTERLLSDWLPDASQAYFRTEAQVLKQILGWSVGRFISSSPLANLRLEKGNRREVIVSIDDHRRLVAAAGPSLRFLLWLCWWTGSRPIELRSLRWEHMRGDCETAVLREHKTARKTGRARVLYFPINAQAILRAHRCLSGPVFTNRNGKPWTKDALCRRIAAAKTKAKVEVTAYAYRHTFITRALVQGIQPATVAELAGTSVEMIARNYGHLDKMQGHLMEAVRSIRS